MEEESVDYPNIAKAVAKEVQNKKAEKGILICRSGLGMSICAKQILKELDVHLVIMNIQQDIQDYIMIAIY